MPTVKPPRIPRALQQAQRTAVWDHPAVTVNGLPRADMEEANTIKYGASCPEQWFIHRPEHITMEQCADHWKIPYGSVNAWYHKFNWKGQRAAILAQKPVEEGGTKDGPNIAALQVLWHKRRLDIAELLLADAEADLRDGMEETTSPVTGLPVKRKLSRRSKRELAQVVAIAVQIGNTALNLPSSISSTNLDGNISVQIEEIIENRPDDEAVALVRAQMRAQLMEGAVEGEVEE